MFLLGGITSLPEIATVGTASITGNAPLAVNNLLGTAAINILLLAVADAFLGRDALTSAVASASTLLQGTLGMILLSGVAAIIIWGDSGAFGIGIGSSVLLLACVGSLWLSSRYSREHIWEAVGDGQDRGNTRRSYGPLRGLVIRTIAAAAVILVAGFLLASSADAIAAQSGIGSNIIGLVVVGFATSLPEVSSIVAALRLRRYELAVGDIFGTNIFNIAIIFLADAGYRRAPVLAEMGKFEVLATLIALTMTGIFVIGLLERKDRTVLRMGCDSVGAIVVYLIGLVLLFTLQSPGI
jgi:cation:H+ antiporter